MALLDLKITFKDGTTQKITAVGPRVDGDWLTFWDGTGEKLRVPAKDVESVSRDGVADREKHAPRTAAV
jgi:hypothetical protein